MLSLESFSSISRLFRNVKWFFVDCSFFVRAPKQVVRRGPVEIRQANQDVRGDVPQAQLVVAICLPRAGKHLGNCLLRQISVFPQVANSSIHISSPKKFYTIANYGIDFRNNLWQNVSAK